MRELWFYDWMSRRTALNYRLKIMLVAFIGTHIPLIAVAVYLALLSSPDWATFVGTLAVTLVATLGGTAATLFVLDQLLRPVLFTSRALRTYRDTRVVTDLPRHHGDEVGTLMANAGATMQHLEGALDRLEHVDETTGLPNRRQLCETIDALVADGTAFTVSVVRFGDHERIATTFDAGQAELAAASMARRLGGRVSEGGLLARIAPSHFAILERAAPVDGHDRADTMQVETVTTAADRLAALVSTCNSVLTVGRIDITPSLRGGVSAFPQDGATANALLDDAVSAAAQGTLAAPIVVHSTGARQAAKDRFQLEQDLRRALAQDELRLHYQPVVDVAEDRVTGAEALLRWQHPEHGMISPGAFIPVAEASGLIQPIGLWVLDEACRQARSWADNGLPEMRVAVNLSARQFLDRDMTRHVTRALAQAGIAPNLLELELTETSAMADQAYTRRAFTALRDLGVGIAIDDFGTGYASMSYLRKLPFNKLKIDREFVQDVHARPESQAICNALIALSQGLGLKVLAEGTETEQEVNYLSGRGCQAFQGFYFSKPLPAAEFEGAVGTTGLRALHERMAAKEQIGNGKDNTGKETAGLSAAG